jgi:hypothetical protein
MKSEASLQARQYFLLRIPSYYDIAGVMLTFSCSQKETTNKLCKSSAHIGTVLLRGTDEVVQSLCLLELESFPCFFVLSGGITCRSNKIHKKNKAVFIYSALGGHKAVCT